VWAHNIKQHKKNVYFFLTVEKNELPLQRYPENNLFTLKKTNTY